MGLQKSEALTYLEKISEEIVQNFQDGSKTLQGSTDSVIRN